MNAEHPNSGLKKGDHVRTPEGGEWTVCYWFLDGVGVVPGLLDLADIPDAELPEPKAMLREPYKGAEVPCIGGQVELLET